MSLCGKFSGLLVSSLLLALNGCYGTVSESEPENNRMSSAQTIRSDQDFEGTYYSAKGRDTDFLIYRVEKGSMIRGDLTGVKGVDAEIRLYKPGVAEPFKIINDNQSSLGESFGPVWFDPPAVIVGISPLAGVNQTAWQDLSYTFNANIFIPSGPIEYEPNDNFSTAQEINGENMLGYYNTVFSSDRSLEKDFYFIDIRDEKKYSVNLTVSGVQSIDPILRIYNAKGENLKAIDERAIGQGENLSSYGIQGPGRIYFSINAKDNRINTSQYYEIFVKKSEYESKYELEPNDDMKRASILSEETTFGEISDRHDNDWYRYSNANTWPVQLRLKLATEDNLNARMDLYRAGRLSLSFDDGGRDEDEGISNQIVAPGETVHLRVFTQDFEAQEGQPYQLELNVQALADNTEAEPNNNRATANPLLPGASLVGYINPDNDTDVYRLKNTRGQPYKILVDGIAGCRLSLSIADKAGNVQKSRPSRSMGEGISLTSHIDEGGLLFISCKQTKENLFNSPYTITVKPPE